MTPFNSDRTPLQRLLWLGGMARAAGKAVEDTASGNPLSFVTDLAKPLSRLVASFLPVQSGTGDPSPDNVRSITGWSGVNVYHGQNLYDYSDNENGFLDSTGKKQSSNNWEITDFIPVSGSDIVYDGITTAGTAPHSAWYNESKTLISTFKQQTGKNTLSIPSGAKYVRFSLLLQGEIDDIHNFKLFCPTTYPVVFPALGKNLLPLPKAEEKSGVTLSHNADGSFHISGTATSLVYFDFFNGNFDSEKFAGYKLVTVGYTQTTGITFRVSKADRVALQSSESGSLTIENNGGGLYFALRIANGTSLPQDGLDVYPMLISENASTTFEPFTNTIFGGYVDLVTGVLTVTHGILDLGDTSWIYNTSGEQPFMTSNKIANVVKRPSASSVLANIICSALKTVSAYSVYMGTSTNGIGIHSNGDIRVVFEDMPTDTSDFKTAVNGWKLVYELATPQIYQLTPTQITALIGNNTVWSDANGDCEVTFLKKG